MAIDIERTTAPKTRLSYDHRTAWRYAYSVYRGSDYLGLIYRGSDDRWHALADDGRSNTARDGGWRLRRDAVYFLEQPR